MTTIIATRTGIHADTKCSFTVPFKVKKHIRVGGSIFAGAGDLDELGKFFEWRQGGDKPEIEDTLDVLEVCAEGIFIWGKKLVRLTIYEDVYAVGSGAQFAIGAMAAGATPKQALIIAAKYDHQTAAPFEFVRFNR